MKRRKFIQAIVGIGSVVALPVFASRKNPAQPQSASHNFDPWNFHCTKCGITEEELANHPAQILCYDHFAPLKQEGSIVSYDDQRNRLATQRLLRFLDR